MSAVTRPNPAVFDPLAQARYDLAQAQARLMELEEDAQLMRDLKREIKGMGARIWCDQSTTLCEVQSRKLAKIMRRIQTEANMEAGAA